MHGRKLSGLARLHFQRRIVGQIRSTNGFGGYGLWRGDGRLDGRRVWLVTRPLPADQHTCIKRLRMLGHAFSPFPYAA